MNTAIGVVKPNPKISQQGLFATHSFSKGSIIISFEAKEETETPNYLTVQVGASRHIVLFPEYLEFINHSCKPNVFFNTDTMKLQALADINEGDELCFFYPSTEWQMDQAFICSCGADNCIKEITGAHALPETVLQRYQLTSYIAHKLKERQLKKIA